jgi:SAM-dependent methyltransferase
MYLYPPGRANTDFSVLYLEAMPNATLLDVGCGNGSMLRTMHRLGWHVEGVDPDKEAVRFAASKGLKVHHGNLAAQKFRDSSFDAVTLSHVIEHVHDPLALVQECHRILKPHGRLSLATPNGNSFGHRLYKSSWLALDPPRHLHIFTVAALARLLREVGFCKIRAFTTIRDASNLFLASRAIRASGKYQWGSKFSPLTATWGRLLQMIEWTMLAVNSELGEDIAVAAQKTAND